MSVVSMRLEQRDWPGVDVCDEVVAASFSDARTRILIGRVLNSACYGPVSIHAQGKLFSRASCTFVPNSLFSLKIYVCMHTNASTYVLLKSIVTSYDRRIPPMQHALQFSPTLEMW